MAQTASEQEAAVLELVKRCLGNVDVELWDNGTCDRQGVEEAASPTRTAIASPLRLSTPPTPQAERWIPHRCQQWLLDVSAPILAGSRYSLSQPTSRRPGIGWSLPQDGSPRVDTLTL